MAALNELEVFFGDAHEAAARVYVRLPRRAAGANPKISGELVGPECRFAQTLTARIPFRDSGPGESLLAEAVVPDPCFWTPDLPMLYRVGVRVQGLGARAEGRGTRAEGPPPEPAAQAPLSPCGRGAGGEGSGGELSGGEFAIERLFGIRRLGTRSSSLVLDTKRWVPRGVWLARITPDDLFAAREAAAVLAGPAPDDAVCLEASRHGVPLFVVAVADEQTLLAEVRRLGQWPAVFAIVFNSVAPVDDSLRRAARNVLFAVALSAEQPTVPPWADVILYDSEDSSPPADWSRPILISRRIPATRDIAAARAACDELQYRTASQGDFAGYFVSNSQWRTIGYSTQL